ncbi:MAG: hypothetical protein A2W05_02160 [Candidatus Schekmanbacteria bacterium RBG_16_38_10]|uniref:Carboxypeptidase regulatory-like domain-containing protein n=1 Tax=Candidatus Schekmanbacteria bacterium RBG_16_38_10 TaxID=1817879 RepID=A0A1F7RYV7_9BACT|nr:MAG: hypothetical protein A2W05_02160 [Candidatus Schekmanbacteria bacterium RBG_16_38_10]
MKVVGITLVTFIILFSYSFIRTEDTQGLPISSATVTVTDFLNITQTVLTDTNGDYTITGIASGAFSGNITKNGYASYPFFGTMTAGQTIIIIKPHTANNKQYSHYQHNF